MSLVSIVVPVFNEKSVLPEFHRQLSNTMNGQPVEWEVVYVNDGSRDDSLNVIRALRAADAHVGIVSLSRNFGKEIALTAGLDHAQGDAVVAIDADLQHPPEVIPELLSVWLEEEIDMIYAQRLDRSGET